MKHELVVLFSSRWTRSGTLGAPQKPFLYLWQLLPLKTCLFSSARHGSQSAPFRFPCNPALLARNARNAGCVMEICSTFQTDYGCRGCAAAQTGSPFNTLVMPVETFFQTCRKRSSYVDSWPGHREADHTVTHQDHQTALSHSGGLSLSEQVSQTAGCWIMFTLGTKQEKDRFSADTFVLFLELQLYIVAQNIIYSGQLWLIVSQPVLSSQMRSSILHHHQNMFYSIYLCITANYCYSALLPTSWNCNLLRSEAEWWETSCSLCI